MAIIRIENGISALKSKMIMVENIDSTVVTAGNYINYEFTPPYGFLWDIKSMYLFAGAPPGATSSFHRFDLSTGDIQLIRGSSVFGSSLRWDTSHWIDADHEQLPPDALTTLFALINTSFSTLQPIKFRYDNHTDANSSGTRVIRLYIHEQSIIN